MSKDGMVMSAEQMRDAQQTLDIAAFNGLVTVAILLKKRGLINDAELDDLHAAVTKPLTMPEVANNPLVQDAYRNLDSMFSALRGRR